MSEKQAKKNRKAKQYSGLEQHRRSGNTLTPPWLAYPNLGITSWKDDRLPEMLWAVLIATQLERDAALEVFRAVARFGSLKRGVLKVPVTLSGIALMPADARDEIIGIISDDLPNRLFLSCLAAFKDLPARDAWVAKLGEPLQPIDMAPLMWAVARTLDHQSREATDCRWAYLYFQVASGQYLLATEEGNRELAEYPSFGDQRAVRPSIRSGELVQSRTHNLGTSWQEKFWGQCLVDTPCRLPENQTDSSFSKIGTTVETLNRVVASLVEHARSSLRTTATDPKHDTLFGTALYCLSILRELLRPGAGNSILARMGLRTILECYVTLAYLVRKNDEVLWRSYRVYGAGQAKLSFLKVDQDDERPAYISAETLKALANEDQWQEFLPIDLGHWNRSNLRQLSVDADVKADYDRYYSWPSAYAHGHWGPVRDTVFTTCINPLHRLHRVPLASAKRLDDVTSDACHLADKILALVGQKYPTFESRLAVPISDAQPH